MSAMGGRPGAPPDIVVSGRERASRQWSWLTSQRGRIPRWWTWIALAALLLAAGAVLVVARPQGAAADFRALQSRWAAAGALDAGRNQVIARLTREATPSDLTAVTTAVRARQRQEADRLARPRGGGGGGP